jgi:hypothetical protein
MSTNLKLISYSFGISNHLHKKGYRNFLIAATNMVQAVELMNLIGHPASIYYLKNYGMMWSSRNKLIEPKNPSLYIEIEKRRREADRIKITRTVELAAEIIDEKLKLYSNRKIVLTEKVIVEK